MPYSVSQSCTAPTGRCVLPDTDPFSLSCLQSATALSFTIHKPSRTTKLALLVPILFACIFTLLTLRAQNGPLMAKVAKGTGNCYGNIFLQMLATASVVVMMTSRVSGKRMSLRKLTIFFVVYEVRWVLSIQQ